MTLLGEDQIKKTDQEKIKGPSLIGMFALLNWW